MKLGDLQEPAQNAPLSQEAEELADNHFIQSPSKPFQILRPVNQSWISRCQEEFSAGFYWYGNKRRGLERPPKWVDRLLRSGSEDTSCRGVTTGASSRHGAQHAAISDPHSNKMTCYGKASIRMDVPLKFHSSPEDTPGTAQEDQPF